VKWHVCLLVMLVCTVSTLALTYLSAMLFGLLASCPVALPPFHLQLGFSPLGAPVLPPIFIISPCPSHSTQLVQICTLSLRRCADLHVILKPGQKFCLCFFCKQKTHTWWHKCRAHTLLTTGLPYGISSIPTSILDPCCEGTLLHLLYCPLLPSLQSPYCCHQVAPCNSRIPTSSPYTKEPCKLKLFISQSQRYTFECLSHGPQQTSRSHKHRESVCVRVCPSRHSCVFKLMQVTGTQSRDPSRHQVSETKYKQA